VSYTAEIGTLASLLANTKDSGYSMHWYTHTLDAPRNRKQMTSQIVRHTARSLLPICAMALLITLSGCSLGGPAAAQNGNNNNVVVVTGQNTTPAAFPPFTVGAWVYNPAPQIGEPDRLYVLTRVQDPTMKKPAQPPSPGVQVTVLIDGVSQNTTTDSDGFAVFPFNAADTHATPSVIQVLTSYNGQSYRTTTFYTSLPQITVTPGPSKTPTPAP
jgi:hypothetical protein